MKSRYRYCLVFTTAAFSLFLLIFIPGCKGEHAGLDLHMYKYRDTRELVRFVHDAYLILEKDGMKSLDYFRKNRKRFNASGHYLYIYDMNGTNIYHAGMKELEGKNLKDVTDINGKKITELIVEALQDTNNPHAWVHYSWWEPGKFYPVPKSSCHFKIKTPEGKEIFVGGGISYPHEEQEFARIVVDDAAQLMREKGKKALTEIADPESKYNFREVRVFVFTSDGNQLISPAVNSSFSQSNLLECVDEVGHKPFVTALKTLEHLDNVWSVFMAKSKYQRALIKKSLYIHKTVMDGEEVYAAAVTDFPAPPF